MFARLKSNTFLLKVLALCLLCTALSEARADVKGIPATDEFAAARFPYARVVDGCTAWRRPANMGDEWGNVSFAGACQQHDLCYHTAGKGWGDCNQGFLQDLRASCDRDLKRAALAAGKLGNPDGDALRLCYDIANLYFAKVQESDAAKRFQIAQQQQQAYLGYVRGVVDGLYKAVLRRGATDKEKDRALETLSQDYSLEDLRSALMGARVDEVNAAGGAAGAVMPAIDDSALQGASIDTEIAPATAPSSEISE